MWHSPYPSLTSPPPPPLLANERSITIYIEIYLPMPYNIVADTDRTELNWQKMPPIPTSSGFL